MMVDSKRNLQRLLQKRATQARDPFVCRSDDNTDRHVALRKELLRSPRRCCRSHRQSREQHRRSSKLLIGIIAVYFRPSAPDTTIRPELSDSWRSFQNSFVNLAKSFRALEMVPPQAKKGFGGSKSEATQKRSPFICRFLLPLVKRVAMVAGRDDGRLNAVGIV